MEVELSKIELQTELPCLVKEKNIGTIYLATKGFRDEIFLTEIGFGLISTTQIRTFKIDEIKEDYDFLLKGTKITIIN